MSTHPRSAVLVVPVLLAAVALAPAGPDSPKPAAPAADPAAVPKDVVAYVALNVAGVWDHEALLPVRAARGKLEFAWAVQSLVGIIPENMDRLTVFWHRASPDVPYVVVTARKPLDPAAVVNTLTIPGATEPKPLPDGKVRVAPGAEFAYILPIDARTVLLAPKAADPARLGELADATLPLLANAARGHSLAVGVDVQAIRDLPLPFGGPLLEARTAVLTADAGKDSATLKLVASFPTAAEARAADPILRAKIGELAGWAKAREKKAEEQVAAGNAYTAPLMELMASTLKGAKVRTAGNTLVATSEVKLDDAVSRVMMAVPDAALTPRGSSAAENNLKQIGLAFHSYADANGACVSNSYDKDGKPLLSWRVHLLPYIEQAALYQQFKLDEPWDSPNNKPLSMSVVRVYQAPGRPARQPWETYFRGFIGPKDVKPEHRPWLREGETKGPNFPANFPDGTSNTWLVVEAADAVPWAKPDDLLYDGIKPLPKLGGPGGSYVVGFADGSVRSFRRGQIDETNMRRLISVADGQAVSIPDR